jgi:hypothetical protein
MRARLVFIVGWFTFCLGCGSSAGGGGAALDCAWLQGENCWKATATAAVSCLPPRGESGVLSADNSTCTYASGAVVAFTPPLVLPIPTGPIWNFTVSMGGQPCLHYEDAQASGIKLTVAGQTVTEGVSGGVGLRVTCPDGTSYANANAFELLSCQGDGGATFGGLPGDAYSSTSTSVSLSLLSTSTMSSSALPVFDCAK